MRKIKGIEKYAVPDGIQAFSLYYLYPGCLQFLTKDMKEPDKKLGFRTWKWNQPLRIIDTTN